MIFFLFVINREWKTFCHFYSIPNSHYYSRTFLRQCQNMEYIKVQPKKRIRQSEILYCSETLYPFTICFSCVIVIVVVAVVVVVVLKEEILKGLHRVKV